MLYQLGVYTYLVSYSLNLYFNFMRTDIKRGIIPVLILCGVMVFIVSRQFNSPKYLKEKQPLKYALKLARDNRSELEKVLEYYINDSLKLEAAKFLIKNMPQKRAEHFEPYQGNNAMDSFDPLSFSNSQFLTHVDSLKIHYRKTFVKSDVQNISSAFLIKHIDKVFDINRYQDKSIFFEYLLPYRVGTEPLEDFSTSLIKHHFNFFDSVRVDTTNVVKSVIKLCNYLNGKIVYDARLLIYPQHYTCKMMDSLKAGDCFQIANNSLKYLRTMGIACALDYVPVWADCNGSHSWTVAITPQGEYPFGAAYDAPGEMVLFHRPPKVFRKTFSISNDSLAKQISKHQTIPPRLYNRNYIDVTHKYFSLMDITIPLANTPPKKHNTAFICVFNNGRWQAVDWGKIDRNNNQIKFTNVVDSLLYCAMYFYKNRMHAASYPFIIKNKTIQYFNPKGDSGDISIHKIWKKNDIQKDKYYTLYYWENGWQTIETALPQLVRNETLKKNIYELHYSDVPRVALLWLGGTTRPFWMENGQQIFKCNSRVFPFYKLN